MASSTPLPAALNATEEDIQQLLAAQCHIGSKNCDKAMEPYVWKRRADGEQSFSFPAQKKSWVEKRCEARILGSSRTSVGVGRDLEGLKWFRQTRIVSSWIRGWAVLGDNGKSG